MVSGDGVVHGFPQSLDSFDPGIVDGLEEQLELRIAGQPPGDDIGLVDDVVAEDELDAMGPAVCLS